MSRLVHWGFNVLHSDVDVVWFRWAWTGVGAWAWAVGQLGVHAPRFRCLRASGSPACRTPTVSVTHEELRRL